MLACAGVGNELESVGDGMWMCVVMACVCMRIGCLAIAACVEELSNSEREQASLLAQYGGLNAGMQGGNSKPASAVAGMWQHRVVAWSKLLYAQCVHVRKV